MRKTPALFIVHSIRAGGGGPHWHVSAARIATNDGFFRDSEAGMASIRSRIRCSYVTAGLSVLGLVTVLVLVADAVGAQTPNRVGFTEDQAEQGRVTYAERCASCHGAALDDGAGKILGTG